MSPKINAKVRTSSESTNQDNLFRVVNLPIAAGKKTITIRDKSESNYEPNSQVEVFTLETGKKCATLR